MTTRIHTKFARRSPRARDRGSHRVGCGRRRKAVVGDPLQRARVDRVRAGGHDVSIPANLANFREPGSVGWVPSSGAVATNASAAGSTGRAP